MSKKFFAKKFVAYSMAFAVAFASVNVNIENMANGSKGEVAYTIIETNEKVSDDVVKAVMAVEGVSKVLCY